MSTTLRFLYALAATLLLLSVVAAVWRETPPPHVTRLLWVSDNNPSRTEQIDTFKRENPGTSLSLDYGNFGTMKIIMQCSSGVGSDLFDIYDAEEDQLQTYVESGVILDVTEQAQTMGFSAENDGWETAKDSVSCYGRQYAYPCNVGANILVYNRNIFDELQIPYPGKLMTWDQFGELGRTIVRQCAASRNYPDVVPVAGLNWRVFFDSLRGEFFTPEGELQIEKSAILRKAFQMHHDFIFRDQLMLTTVDLNTLNGQGGWGSGAWNQFAAGRFAMVATGEWAIIAFERTYRSQLEAIAANRTDGLGKDRPLRLGCVLLPHFAELPPTYRLLTRCAGINALSSNRQAALNFLRFLAGPSYSSVVNRSADFLPGNPKYSELDLQTGPPDLARLEMHEVTKEAVKHAYTPRRSRLLSTTEIARALKDQIDRMESDPRLKVEDLLHAAEMELQFLIRRRAVDRE